MGAIVVIFILLAVPTAICVSRLKLAVKVLCLLDFLLIVGLIILYINWGVRYGYGRNFFQIDCSSLAASMKDHEDPVILAAIQRHLDTGEQFSNCLGRVINDKAK